MTKKAANYQNPALGLETENDGNGGHDKAQGVSVPGRRDGAADLDGRVDGVGGCRGLGCRGHGVGRGRRGDGRGGDAWRGDG